MATSEFKGLKKEEHERLKRAVTMYHNLTGETVDISGIPIENPEEDAKAKAKRAEKDLQEQADITRKSEEAQQRERQLRARPVGGDVQDENPGPGQPAMVTERAKAQGKRRKGQEPKSAGGSDKAAASEEQGGNALAD